METFYFRPREAPRSRPATLHSLRRIDRDRPCGTLDVNHLESQKPLRRRPKEVW